MELDLRKNPYRGILSQVAKERGVTQQSITHAYKAQNYEVTRRIIELVKERDEVIRSVNIKKATPKTHPNLAKNDGFLDSNQRVAILGLSKCNFRALLKRGKVDQRYLSSRKSPGGFEWLVKPEGLPLKWRQKWDDYLTKNPTK